jgi:M6 family metalloprotease-like protein
MNRQWLLSVFVLGWVLVAAGHAMPPRDNIAVSQPEMDEQARLGINITRTPVRDPGMRGIANGPGSVRPLVVGTKRFPVVAIKFPDFNYTNTIPQFDSMLFGTWPSGSARDYYEQVSYGAFHMTGVTLGWYTSDSVKARYGYSRGFDWAARLVKEAAQKSDASTNYALYDNDDDGYVDAFTCIHAGMGYEESGNGADIWSHSWSFNDAGIGEYTTNDPWPGHSGQYIKINDYTTDPERSNYTNHGGMVSIGVFCHEWGHALGLPDLYDTDGGGQGLGCWSLMAAGSWGANNSSPWYPAHLDPWSKMELGWLNPTAVRQRDIFSLPQVETNAKAYWLIGRNRTFKEYFLVENRRKTLFDTLMYNQGLLIYHIDDSVALSRWSSNRVNAGGSGWLYGVALEQADGADHLFSGGNRGDANDPWPGGLSRTNYDSTATTPNSRTNYPTSGTLVTSCLAKNIPASTPTMACTLASGVSGQFTGGPDAAGYSWIDSDTTGGPGYAWNDISGTGTLLGYGDDTRWPFILPYSFNFYGTNYDTVWVCSNGWLSFGADPGTNAPANAVIPNAAAPNRAVFAFWDDLNGVQPDSGGVYYRNFGTSPNCSTVVMWKHARVKPSQDPVQNQVSFQVVLYQNGRIQLRYRDLWLTDTLRKWGRSASVGIENSAGTVGLSYLYNGSVVGNLLANERSIEFRPNVRHDVGATRILVPTGTLDSGAVVTPACSVYNYGSVAETYNVRMRVGSYNLTAPVSGHAPGTAAYVTFPNWTALPRGTLAVTCSTELGGDVAPANDKQTGTVTVQVRDAACAAIIAPTGTIDSGAAVTPQARVKNLGTQVATFPVTFRIGSFYTNTQTVTGLAAGDSIVVSFNTWTANQRGTHATRCTTALTGDLKTSNDALSGSVSVRVLDAAAVRILAPPATVDSGVGVAPQARVRNLGTDVATFPVTFRIGSVYTNTQTVTALNPGDSAAVSFTNWVPAARGSYTMRCTTALTGDRVAANDTVGGTVTVRVRDVGVTRLLAPAGTLDSGNVVTPACSVYNYGTTTETYPVRMYFGGFYDNTATVTAHAPGTRAYVTFPNWTATQRGTFALTCTTRMTGDAIPANDRQTGTVTVRVVDAQAVSIDAPTGTVDSGTMVTPRATVRNNGTVEATFDVRLSIGSGYANTQTVAALAAGSSRAVSFAQWTAAQRGTFATLCTTMLAGDVAPANNRVSDQFNVAVHDVEAVAITSPAGVITPGAVIPAARVRNNGTAREPVQVVFAIQARQPYRDSVILPNGLPFSDTAISFRSWNAPPGRFVAGCTTRLASDQVPANDGKRLAFTAGSPRWTEMKPVPVTPSGRLVKDGGWLAVDQGLIYAIKGNKAFDFYGYNPVGDTWRQLAPIGAGLEGKSPNKGAAGCGDGNGQLYATKGNNTQGFWEYHVLGDSWQQRRNVPLGLSNKKVKGGTDIVWAYKAGTGYPYLLKGYRNEFYRYYPAGDSWRTLAPAPGAKWDKGSWLVYDGSRYIFAHKARYHEFYAFDTDADSWVRSPVLHAMPIPGSGGTKKSKDGGCATWFDGAAYALKGGNTKEFWRYAAAGDSWTELDTMPAFGSTLKKKKVKAGGDIVNYGDGVLYALKGNKTHEFWRYIVPAYVANSQPARDGVEAGRLTIDDWRLTISPNPLAGGFVHLVAGGTSRSRPALVRLYDVAGRCVGVWKPLLRNGATDLDVRHLAAGVYLVRVEAEGFAGSQKLVLQR